MNIAKNVFKVEVVLPDCDFCMLSISADCSSVMTLDDVVSAFNIEVDL